MTIVLSEEQRHAVDEDAAAIRVIDTQTNAAYVLMREVVYDRIQGLSESGPLTAEERRAVIRGVWRRADWDDPSMTDYARLNPRVKS